MNIIQEINKLKNKGYNEANAIARLSQDIVLLAISNSSMNKNVTIKGGVVMRSISKNERRATQDIDFDFIKYSINDKDIDRFVLKLNNIDGITIKRVGKIQDLKHQDYNGKRIIIEISDGLTTINSKVDIGVHNLLDVRQEEYCFDVCFNDENISLLINSYEQMVAEKLKSLLRFGARSTRYKDVFDIYYLLPLTNNNRLQEIVSGYIYEDSTLDVNNKEELIERIKRTFSNDGFIKNIEKSDKNWLELDIGIVTRKIVQELSDK